MVVSIVTVDIALTELDKELPRLGISAFGLNLIELSEF